MLGYGVSIGDSISEIEEEQRKKKPLPPISEMADLLLAADGHAVPSAPGNPGSGTSSPLPPISEAADKILSGTAQDASVNSKQLPPISEAADMLLAGVPSAPASVPAIDRSEHGNNMALNLNVPEAAKDPLHIGAATQNAYWNLQESKGNTAAMRAFQLEQSKKQNAPGGVVAVNRSGVAPMTPVEEAVMLRQMAAKDRGDMEQAAGLEKSFDYRVDELKENAKRLWEAAEKGRVKYDLPDNEFGAAILQTIESSGMTVEAALRSGALWALGGPALGLMGSFVNTATEADYEAGETFVKALKAGKSPEEIQDAVNSVRVKNLALLSLTNPLGDVLLFGLGKPLKALAGKIAGKGLLAKAGRSVVERGVPYVLGAAPEGVEGGSQEAFQQQAAGQDLDWEKIKEAAGSEALASLLYGLVGRGIRGGAKVLLGGQADSDGGKPGEPPAPPPGSGETSQTDGKPLSPQERVRSKLLELREKIFSSYLGPGPHINGAPPELNWDRMSSVMKKQVLRLRKAMELWDAGKYDEAERLASLLKDEMMPEKDTPLWAPVEETDEPGAKTEGEPAQGETAEPSMPISEAADQVLAAPPETQTESAEEEKKAGTIRIGNREISIVDTDDSDENGPTGGAGGGGIVLPGERRGRNTSMPGTDTSGTAADTSTPRERVKGTIREQLEAIAAQGGEQAKMLGSEEIDAYSTLFAAMAEQAGKRQGISAGEWLQSQNLTIVNGRPEFEMKDNSLELKQNAGVNSKTAPRHALGRAKQMERAGKRSARDIYAETGWFRGPDGEWRYVIDDSKASIAPDFKNAVSKLKLKAVSKQDVTLGELLDHPDLYAAYPHLKNVKIKVDFGRAGGAYLEGNYPLSLELGTQSLTNDTKPATDDELVETLLHEIQHSIQAAEGFTRGGNLQMVQARMQALWDRKDDPDLTEEEREAARNELKKFDYDPSQKEFKPNRQTLYDAYRRIGGEAEARLTSWYRNARDKDTRLPNDAMAAMLKSEWLMRHSQDLNDILLKPKRGSLWDFGVPWSVSERDMGFGSDEIVQAISSANTSLNQIAATFRHPKFSPVDKNLDIGGGKFNKGTEFLASRGIENVIFDPYNRPSTENKAVIKRLKSGERFPTVTSNNVLNVIAEQSVRENVILQSAKALSPDGTAYFLIHEGDSSGVGKETTRGWQNNKKTNEYMNEIKKHFNNVTKSGNLLIARNPVNTNGLAAWDSSPDVADRVFFQKTGEAGESSEQGPVADEVTTRGSTLFGEGSVTITLGKTMDRTTLVHEFGHLFLADLFKQAKNGVVSAIRDLNVLMSWWTQEASWLAKWISANKYGTFTAEQAARFAGKDGAQLVRDALAGKADPDTAQVVFIAGHEMFARGFERYLSDGTAPNSQLKAVFERFKTWMAEVYGKLVGDPNFKLSQDAREVMDRMVGGENAAAQAGTAENVSVARNGNETVVTLNESLEDSSGGEFFQKDKKKRPGEGSIPPGQEPALQTQIRPASGQALFKKDTLDSAPSQKEYTGEAALDLKTAVERGHISREEADFMEAMISAFPQSFQERFEVQVSPDAHPGGTSAYSIHKMGGTLEDAKHMVTLFKGGNVIDAIHGFGRFIHDRALTGADVRIVKSTWQKADTKLDRAEWFADQFTSWWIDGQTQNRGMAGVFRKMMKALKGLVDKFRGKNVLHPDMEALLNDIVTNGREISEKYFFNDADFVRKYLLGVDPDPNDWLGEGFSDNSKTFTSWDPGNLCPKKDSFIEYIVARMKKEGKTYADLVNVDLIAQWYDDALKEGIQVPCSYCYVEQARRKAIQFQQQGKSITGVRFAMAKTSIRAIPYNGALLNERRFSDKKINEMNKRGGLRMFSFSDYIRAVHRVQIGKMLRDAAKRMLSVKAITKVAEFVEDFASTGITINQSLDAMNPMFGMDWDLAVQNKEKYPNVKIRVVARNLEEFDRFWKLKYRVKPDGSIEYLDAWKTRKQDRTDQSGLPTKPAKDYEKRLAEDGWKEMVDVITPYHHDDYTSPVPKGYEDLVWDGKSMRELRRQNPDIVNRTCCQEGGKCYNAKTGEQCQCNCGLGAGNLSIPKGIPEALNEMQLFQGAMDAKTPSNKKKQQQALTHKAEDTEQARRMTNAPENPWPDEGSPILEQDIEDVFGTRNRAAAVNETPWPGEGEDVTEADIDEMFSEGPWSAEEFSSAVQAIDDFFTPETKKRGGGEKGPNDPKNRERYDKEGNQLSENPQDASYLNPIYTLTSPSLLAKKNKLFAPFFKMAKEAQELQETLRRDFNTVLDKAWGILSDDQSQALNEILIEGDLRGRTFTDEQLTARGLDEDVRRGYSLIRDLSDRVGKAVRQRQRESGTKVMGWREGYVPHIFHGFFIRLDGRIVDTARSLQEAVELARNVEKDHPGNMVDIVSKPNDFSGSSAYNASALNDRKLLTFSTTMEEAFAFTPDEAERFLKGYDKKAFKNRIFAFSHERLGVKGWDQDMKFAFRHYVNQSARFLAMDELKYRGLGLFEKTWGNFKHEYKGISKYTKDYLNDVLGVPSNASTQMNEWFKRIPGMYKISKQVFGDRPAEYLASVFTKGMGVAKLGFLNIASAMMNLSQLINASALLGYNDLRRGVQEYFANLRNPSERVTRIYEETGVSENLNVAAGAGYSKASEKMYGAIGRFLELSMAPFAYMDGMCRKATVLAAYNKAHREGKSHTEAIAYAKEINDRANFDYSVADTPAFLRRSGPLGQVIFQFKKFGIKQLELATGLNGFAQNARFWIPMIALSGLWGFPGAELLRALFMALFDRDPQAELNAWMAKEDWISDPVRRTIQYGALSNAGVDISKRVGMGDVIPNELADLLGPTVGTIYRMAPHVATLAGKLFGLEGDGTAALLNALEALSPGLSNPIKAILGEVEDKTRGRLKFKYQGSGERAVRAMGFRPTREAVESDAVRTANYVEAKRMEREREAIDEYVRARDSGSTKDAAKALARLKELKVTPDRIIRELRERKKGTAYERLQQKLKGQKSQEARKVLQGF